MLRQPQPLAQELLQLARHGDGGGGEGGDQTFSDLVNCYRQLRLIVESQS